MFPGEQKQRLFVLLKCFKPRLYEVVIVEMLLILLRLLLPEDNLSLQNNLPANRIHHLSVGLKR